MSNDNFTKGFDGIGRKLSDLIAKIDDKATAIEIVATEFVTDIKKQPKPRSKINVPGYTHLIDTVSYRREKTGAVAVGWGKYYGRMVEDGTVRMRGTPHMKTVWERNKLKYVNGLKSKFGLI